MESEPQTNNPIPTLKLLSLPNLPLKSPHHSGNLTSPLHTSASVPFSWEEHPGKPLPCLTLALPSNYDSATTTTAAKSLELPPRLLNLQDSKFTKTPSPTTVLEGPYYTSTVSSKSSSFRFFTKTQSSFDFEGNFGNTPDSDKGLLGTIILSRSSSFRRCNNNNNNNKGLFGSWRKRGGGVSLKGGSKSDGHGGNFVFSSSISDDGASTTSCDGGGSAVKASRSSWKSTFLGLSPTKPHFWGAIYGAFKQVIPRPGRSTKWKKESGKSVKTSPSLCSTSSL